MLTVKQLIEKLSKFDPEAIIYTYSDSGECDDYAEGVSEITLYDGSEWQVSEYGCQADSYAAFDLRSKRVNKAIVISSYTDEALIDNRKHREREDN